MILGEQNRNQQHRLAVASLLITIVLFLTIVALGQDVIGNAVKMGFTDIAETKRKAEAGDPAAELSLAKTFLGSLRPADALPWFQKAAVHGKLEGLFWWGNLLLNGANGVPPEKSVKADPVAGIQLMFIGATNRYEPAYYEMFKAYRDGRGVPKDTVQAYAWLQLDVDSSPGFITGSIHQSELNRIALDVDVATSQAGKKLAAEYKAGLWPTLTVLAPVAQNSPKPLIPPQLAKEPLYARLTLSGIAFGKNPLAIINGKAVAEGQTITLPSRPNPVTLKCLKIETNAVVVVVDGESETRRLSFK